MNLSVTKLRSGDLLETMRFMYCADTKNFVDAFRMIGITINSEKDLEALVDYNFDNQGFNLRNFVNGINLRNGQIKKCSATFII